MKLQHRIHLALVCLLLVLSVQPLHVFAQETPGVYLPSLSQSASDAVDLTTDDEPTEPAPTTQDVIAVQASTTNREYAGCLNANGVSGEIKNIGIVGQGSAPTQPCKSNEVEVRWSETGPQGEPGPVGPQGPQGEAGTAGLQGPIGPAGPAGPKGETGPAGPQGEQGIQGEQGPIGPTGPQGPAGIQGEIGPAGAVGPQGENGAVGPQGPTGLTGPEGPKGETGPAGPQGPKGDTGAQGSAGIQGEPGPRGDKGDTGEKGEIGPQGPAGPTGPQGPAGSKGETGAVGPMGPTGPQGPKGDKGDTGEAGPVGLQGEPGPKGDTGPIGPQGEAGPVGPQGPAGPVGAQGEQGPIGLTGAQGAPGVGDLGCTTGQIAEWDDDNSVWVCSDDVISLGTEMTNLGAHMVDLETYVGGVKSQVDALAQEQTLADLSCTTDQIAKWNGTAWACANVQMESSNSVSFYTRIGSWGWTSTASCDSGDVATGGGYVTGTTYDGALFVDVYESVPVSAVAWKASGANGLVQASVICADLP